MTCIGLPTVSFLSLDCLSVVTVPSSVSSGITRALPPYQLVNAALFEQKKKKKKNSQSVRILNRKYIEPSIYK